MKGAYNQLHTDIDWIHHFPSYNSHHFNIAHRRIEEFPVAEHFNGKGRTLADMTVMAIDQLYSHNPCLQKIRESRWIRILETSHPLGMNLRVDSLQNLLDDYLWTPWNSTSPIDIPIELIIMY